LGSFGGFRCRSLGGGVGLSEGYAREQSEGEQRHEDPNKFLRHTGRISFIAGITFSGCWAGPRKALCFFRGERIAKTVKLCKYFLFASARRPAIQVWPATEAGRIWRSERSENHIRRSQEESSDGPMDRWTDEPMTRLLCVS